MKFQLAFSVVRRTFELRELVLPGIRLGVGVVESESHVPVQREAGRLASGRHGESLTLAQEKNKQSQKINPLHVQGRGRERGDGYKDPN